MLPGIAPARRLRSDQGFGTLHACRRLSCVAPALFIAPAGASRPTNRGVLRGTLTPILLMRREEHERRAGHARPLAHELQHREEVVADLLIGATGAGLDQVSVVAADPRGR